jgi:transposase
MPLPRAKVVRTSKPRRPKASKWVLLEQKVEALKGEWYHGEILNLPGWKTLKYKELDHDIVVMAEIDTPCASDCACPAGESELKKSGFTDPYYVCDLPVRCKRVRVYYRLQRRFCKRCRKAVQQLATGVDDKHTMTARLIEYVEQESFDLFRSFSDVADEIGRSEQTVRNIFTRRAKELEDEALRLRKEGLYEPPEWLAIDEVYPHKNAEYCVISDPLHHHVVDLLPVNKEKELFRWLLRLPHRDRVKVVTMDMCLEYRRLVKRLLKHARIVVDRYHVHSLLNVAIKGVLDVIRASMTDSERREHMRPEHLLLTGYRKLSTKEEEDERGIKQPSEKDLVDKWLADVPDIAQAHGLKGEFSDILQLKDREKAEELTDEWLRKAYDFAEYFRGKYKKTYPGPWPDPFGNVPHTITDWRDSILNYVDCKSMFGTRTVSNSFAEHVNGRIKEAYRVGHHYSFEVLRLKCVHGGVTVRRRPPHPLDEPRLRIVRSLRSGGHGGQKANPNANLEVLKRARLEADDTRGLLPRPDENPDWARRFDIAEMEKTRQVADDPEPPAEVPLVPDGEEDVRPSVDYGGRKRRIRYIPDQRKLF